MSVISEEMKGQLPSLSEAVADGQDYGIVKVDDEGVIQMYNKWESEMADVPKDQAVGKNFFTQVAPCTNNRLVFGKFKKGVEAGSMDHSFKYTFTYRMKPTNVKIQLYRHEPSKSNWVFVAKA
ncbi:MAG TPA: hypothetical protein RMG48_17585 [Myxococcales bacterium LLY-WYZ-16_1]|mgnify:CR=1 FL=1|jgi:photoactive yellow protein|nr:hypothetical protein [Myxococcales bacterium LLY-WYZ-16_1]